MEESRPAVVAVPLETVGLCIVNRSCFRLLGPDLGERLVLGQIKLVFDLLLALRQFSEALGLLEGCIHLSLGAGDPIARR